MELTGVYKIILVFLFATFVCINCGCSGDDSCGYEIIGCVKNSVDSTVLAGVIVTPVTYNYGDKVQGKGTNVFTTNAEGNFNYESLLTPQRTYSCPTASEIEYRFRYEKIGFSTVDTFFAKGSVIDGGISKRDKTILTIPTIYLNPL